MDRNSIVKLSRVLGAAQIAYGSQCYLEITEGRKNWTQDGQTRKYSWCGDFVTYVLMKCGATNGHGLNRVEINGTWQIGRNIDMLISAARDAGRAYSGKQALNRLLDPSCAGDVIVRAAAGGGHVGILLQSLTGELYETADGNSFGGTTRNNPRNVRDGSLLYVLDSSSYFATGTAELLSPFTPAAVLAQALSTQLAPPTLNFSDIPDDSFFDESETKART